MMTSTMKNAKQFVQRIRTDTTFRKVLYSFGSLDEISDFLEREGLFCSLDDFENTVSGMKLDAVDADQAEEIGEIERWWKLLLSALEPS
ncbi:MAG: Nif11-like leader peptide family natural product precursor [Spirochaetota bacterium]